MSPAIVLVAYDLGFDEAVDAFRGDDPATMQTLQPTASLFRRPALAQASQNFIAQDCVAFEP